MLQRKVGEVTTTRVVEDKFSEEELLALGRKGRAQVDASDSIPGEAITQRHGVGNQERHI